MATTSDLSKGVVIRHNNRLYRVVELEHRTPGNWRAMFMVKMKSLETGEVINERFNAGESIEIVRTEQRPAQYLYTDGDIYFFMDSESYEQIEVAKDFMDADTLPFLRENDSVLLYYADERLIRVEVANFVELRVASTEVAARGDTATNVDKPATLETGVVVRVPAFVKEGDLIRIDTRTGKYMERVSK
jgi:elongation factor P